MIQDSALCLKHTEALSFCVCSEEVKLVFNKVNKGNVFRHKTFVKLSFIILKSTLFPSANVFFYFIGAFLLFTVTRLAIKHIYTYIHQAALLITRYSLGYDVLSFVFLL